MAFPAATNGSLLKWMILLFGKFSLAAYQSIYDHSNNKQSDGYEQEQ
jgi:hypothetical protein